MWVVAQRNRKESGHTESCRRRSETELRAHCRGQRSREANENFLQPREVPSPVEGEHEQTETTEWMDEDSETAPKQSWSRREWECGRWRKPEADILRISNECTKRLRMQSGRGRRKTFEEDEESRRDSAVEVLGDHQKLEEMDHWVEDEEQVDPALMEKGRSRGN